MADAVAVFNQLNVDIRFAPRSPASTQPVRAKRSRACLVCNSTRALGATMTMKDIFSSVATELNVPVDQLSAEQKRALRKAVDERLVAVRDGVVADVLRLKAELDDVATSPERIVQIAGEINEMPISLQVLRLTLIGKSLNTGVKRMTEAAHPGTAAVAAVLSKLVNMVKGS